MSQQTFLVMVSHTRLEPNWHPENVFSIFSFELFYFFFIYILVSQCALSQQSPMWEMTTWPGEKTEKIMETTLGSAGDHSGVHDPVTFKCEIAFLLLLMLIKRMHSHGIIFRSSDFWRGLIRSNRSFWFTSKSLMQMEDFYPRQYSFNRLRACCLKVT